MSPSRTPDHILLMGLRGAGKTALGRVLAPRIRSRFVDLDDVTISVLNRRSVVEAFELDGEGAFRRAETQALDQALRAGPGVIALGGGTPTAPGAATLLAEAHHHALLVYLRAHPATLRARLLETGVSDRPALLGDDSINEIEAVFARRDDLYRSLADVIISVDDLTHDEAMALLLAACET